MKKSVLVALLVFILSSSVLPVFAENNESELSSRAQKNEPYKEARNKLKSMSSEERNDFMQEVKDKWSQLSLQERKEFTHKVKNEVSEIKKAMEERCKEMKRQTSENLTVRLYALELLEEKE